VNADTLISELIFKAVRSSGSGGQHVNKVSSKMELHFNLDSSESFSDEEKQLLLQTLSNRLTKDNRLILQCDETRSQHKNKELVIKRFLNLIKEGLIIPKKKEAN
jgi:ribosome-associated protein